MNDATEAWRLMGALVLDHERRKEVCEALDLSFVRVKALRRLAAAPLTLRQLATLLITDAPYVTVIVDDLVGRGLAERQPHPDDRRAKIVSLTDAGRAAAAEADRIMMEPPAALLALPAEDARTLATILGRLV